MARKKKSKEQYFHLDRDNDSHWYVVPVDKAGDWEDWLSLGDDDPRSWDAPDWAYRIGGSPTLIHFKDWKVR